MLIVDSVTSDFTILEVETIGGTTDDETICTGVGAAVLEDETISGNTVDETICTGVGADILAMRGDLRTGMADGISSVELKTGGGDIGEGVEMDCINWVGDVLD